MQRARQRSRQAGRQAGRQADRQAGRQAGRPKTNWLLIAEWFGFKRLNGAYYVTVRLETQEGYHWSLLTETVRSKLTMQTVWPGGAAALLLPCRTSASRHCASIRSSAHESHTIQFWEKTYSVHHNLRPWLQRGNKYIKIARFVIWKGNRSLGPLPNTARPQTVGFLFVIINTADIFHINCEIHQHSELRPMKI